MQKYFSALMAKSSKLPVFRLEMFGPSLSFFSSVRGRQGTERIQGGYRIQGGNA